MIAAKILLDSLSPENHRLTTMEITYPRFIHSEFLTHRVFSRNSASSRAIPVEKMIQRIEENPVLPSHWGENQKGMQARKEIEHKKAAIALWKLAMYESLKVAKELAHFGVHKQVVNRLLEPFQHITTIVSSTEWDNFFELRCHPDAQPEFQELARAMRTELEISIPRCLSWHDWHMPLLSEAEEGELSDPRMVSAARCARISYLTHDGKRDPEADVKLAERLLESKHMSPFEHVARPGKFDCGNFKGWSQLRHTL